MVVAGVALLFTQGALSCTVLQQTGDLLQLPVTFCVMLKQHNRLLIEFNGS